MEVGEGQKTVKRKFEIERTHGYFYSVKGGDRECRRDERKNWFEEIFRSDGTTVRYKKLDNDRHTDSVWSSGSVSLVLRRRSSVGKTETRETQISKWIRL